MDKNEDEETLGDFVLRTLDEAFIDNIPMDAIKDLPKFYMYFFGAIFEIVSFVMLGYFMYSGYQQGVTSKFISITPSSGVCSEITKAVTGDFMADENGYWVGDPSFDFSTALYSVHLDQAKMTLENYQAIMVSVKQELYALSNISKSMSLDVNLITWMSWQFTCESDVTPACADFQDQVFAFSGSAQYALSLSYIATTLSNEAADCTAQSISTYDLSNAINQGVYNYQEFNSTASCRDIVDPFSLGYVSTLDGEAFDLSYDVRSLVESISVNMGILTMDSLTKIAGAPTHYFIHNGYEYVGNYYVDPVYAGMHPFYCVVNQLEGVSNQNPPPFGVGSLCFVNQGNITGVPLFIHYGAGQVDGNPEDNAPKPCQCDAYGHEPECDVFNLISGFMFFDGMTMTQVVNTWLNITVNNDGAFRMNQHAYNASWAAAASTYAPNVNPIYNDTAWRQSSYDFCRTEEFGTCSILAVNSYGTDVFDSSLTEYLFLLDDGSCAEQFIISDAAFDQMISSPPTPIVETYYDCVMTPSDSLLNAAGVASGNVSLFIPILVFMVLPFMYLWLTLTGNVQSKPEYDQQELDSALQLLALQVLRIRDDHLRGMRKDGLLIELTRELVSAARHADGTAVDSDDSDDDEDYPPSTRGPAKRSPTNNNVNNSTDCTSTSNPLQQQKTDQPPPPRTIRRMSSTADVNARRPAPRRMSSNIFGDDANDDKQEIDNGEHKPIKRKSISSERFLTSRVNSEMIRGVDSDDEEEDGVAGAHSIRGSPARAPRRMSAKARRNSARAVDVPGVPEENPHDVESGYCDVMGSPSMHNNL